MRYILERFDYFDGIYEEKKKTIREICYDITDYDYVVDICGYSNSDLKYNIHNLDELIDRRESYSEISIVRRAGYERLEFTLNDIKETILRIVDYLEDDFIYMEIIPEQGKYGKKGGGKLNSSQIKKAYDNSEYSFFMNLKLIKIVIRYK